MHIKTNDRVDWKKLEELIFLSMEPQPKQRILQLYFGKYPLIDLLISHVVGISYFGFDISENQVSDAHKTYDSYIKNHQARFDQLPESGTIPYVTHFFHHIISLYPQIGLHELPLFLKESHRTLAYNGCMVLVIPLTSHAQILDMLEAIRSSSFTIKDCQAFDFQATSKVIPSLLVVLKKPAKIVVKKTNIVIVSNNHEPH